MKRLVSISPSAANRVWALSVISDTAEEVVTLTVQTTRGIYPVVHEPYGSFVYLRTSYPYGGEQEAMEKASSKDATEACNLLPSGRCFWGLSSTLDARTIWRDHGCASMPATPEGLPESIWLALEAKLAEWTEQSRRQRFDVLPEYAAARAAMLLLRDAIRRRDGER